MDEILMLTSAIILIKQVLEKKIEWSKEDSQIYDLASQAIKNLEKENDNGSNTTN